MEGTEIAEEGSYVRAMLYTNDECILHHLLLFMVIRTIVTISQFQNSFKLHNTQTVWRTEGDDYEPPTNAEEEDDEPEDVLSTAVRPICFRIGGCPGKVGIPLDAPILDFFKNAPAYLLHVQQSSQANIRNMVTSIVWNILRPLPMDKQLKVAEMVSATVDDFSLKLAVKKHEDRKRLREGDDAEGEGAKRRQTEPLEITAEDVREVFSEIQQVVRAG